MIKIKSFWKPEWLANPEQIRGKIIYKKGITESLLFEHILFE